MTRAGCTCSSCRPNTVTTVFGGNEMRCSDGGRVKPVSHEAVLWLLLAVGLLIRAFFIGADGRDR